MTTTATRLSLGVNQYFRRQTKESKFSYFEGSDEELLGYVEQNWPLRKPGMYDGAWIVPLDLGVSHLSEKKFYAAVTRIAPRMFFNAECISRGRHDPPLMCVSAVTKKPLGKYAEVIVYAKSLLGKHRTTTKEFEIVSLHVSDVKNQPEHPYEIARKVLGKDGRSKQTYTPEEIAESILYWGQHVFCKKRFTRHIDRNVVDSLRNGDTEQAVRHRRERYPEEPVEDASEYVNAVNRFLMESDFLYH